MSALWSFLTSWTKSVDDFRKNNSIGGWGGPATVWNPTNNTQSTVDPPLKPKGTPKNNECDTDIADLTGKTNSVVNFPNNLKVVVGQTEVCNPKRTLESETKIADLTGDSQMVFTEFN